MSTDLFPLDYTHTHTHTHTDTHYSEPSGSQLLIHCEEEISGPPHVPLIFTLSA